jgi:hypothetical protein
MSIMPAVKVHSIVAVRRDSPAGNRTDGLVTYVSAHVEGVVSEKVVTSGHLCQDRPEVIEEVRRILAEHSLPELRGIATPLRDLISMRIVVLEIREAAQDRIDAPMNGFTVY